MDLWHRTNIDNSDCYKLDIKDFLFDNSSKPYNTMYQEGAGGIWTIPGDVIFNTKWLDYMRGEFGVDVYTVNTFMRFPFYQHPDAHNDIYEYDGKIIEHCGAINWTLEDDDADMIWYDWPTGVSPENLPVTKRSDIDMNYSIPIVDLKEKGRLCIGQTPTLVNTQVLHNVEMRSKLRILLSVRFFYVVSWQDHIDKFEKALIV